MDTEYKKNRIQKRWGNIELKGTGIYNQLRWVVKEYTSGEEKVFRSINEAYKYYFGY